MEIYGIRRVKWKLLSLAWGQEEEGAIITIPLKHMLSTQS